MTSNAESELPNSATNEGSDRHVGLSLLVEPSYSVEASRSLSVGAVWVDGHLLFVGRSFLREL